jgi:glycosyltransferase involved in cell wall biosynthesis
VGDSREMTVPDPVPNSDRVLLITLMDPDAPPGGRELLSRFNAGALRSVFGDGLAVHQLKKSDANLIDALRGHLNGLDRRKIAQIVTRVGDMSIGQVFVDGSNLGHIVAPIKRAYPDVRIVTFFHNVEARFFLGAARTKRTALSLGLLAANYAAEREAVRHSDAIVCLSARDGDGLRRLYGRGADSISPLALDDALPVPRPTTAPGRYLLFVGSAFYANLRGIKWFAREVAPQSPLPIAIVGRGMEVLQQAFGGSPNIRIIGQVDDLARWYLDAYCVVAPVFDGSGMKTKIAEALMFGKRIIGTAEAFSGYDRDVVSAGWQAETAPEFLAAIKSAVKADLPNFDPAARAMYAASYSCAAATRRMARIMRPARPDRLAAPQRDRPPSEPVSTGPVAPHACPCPHACSPVQISRS